MLFQEKYYINSVYTVFPCRNVTATRRERESRRNVLKKTGYSMAAGGVTLSGLPSVASADPPDDDGPKVGTDVVATTPPGGSDEEWNAYIAEFVDRITPDIPEYSNPGGLALDFCPKDEDLEVCLSTPAYVYFGKKDCGGIQTPKLYWTKMTGDVSSGGVFQVSVEFWIGINPDTDCLWVGQENAGVCTEIGCNLPAKRADLTIDPGPFTAIFENMMEWAADNPDIVVATGAASAMTVRAAGVASGGGGGACVFSTMNAYRR